MSLDQNSQRVPFRSWIMDGCSSVEEDDMIWFSVLHLVPLYVFW